MVSRRMSRFAFSAPPARAGAAKRTSVRIAVTRMRIVCASLLADPRDLRSLDTDPGHESLLIEDEGVDVARDRVAGDRFPESLVDDDDARTDAQLEPGGGVELLERRVVHEEERVA